MQIKRFGEELSVTALVKFTDVRIKEWLKVTELQNEYEM